jgi:hypothetical protein
LVTSPSELKKNVYMRPAATENIDHVPSKNKNRYVTHCY